MPAGAGVKVFADTKEFHNPLEVAARRWERFGREINQGTRLLGESFGAVGASAGKLGRGFELAAKGASIFAGLDGLAGIGASLASGGLVLGGMAALTYAMKLFADEAEAAKKNTEEYVNAIKKIPQTQAGLRQLERDAATLEHAITAKKATIDALSGVGKTGGAIGMGVLGNYNPLLAISGRLAGRQVAKDVDELQAKLDATRAIIDELASSFGSAEGQAKLFDERVSRAVMSIQQMAKGASPVRGILGEIETLSEQIARAIQASGDGMSEAAVKARAWAQALEDAARAVAKTQNEAAARRAGKGVQAGGLIAQTPADLAFLLNSNPVRGNILNPLNPRDDLKPELFEPVRAILGETERQTTAIEAGFAELPNALSSVLAGLLGPLFAGSRGGQIGASLFGAVGGGIGAHIGAGLGTGVGAVIGGAFLPVIGTAIGGLLGGAIGGLFGGHKKRVDQSADALERLARTAERVNEAITNLPIGIKVALARFNAADPVRPPLPPVGGFTPPPTGTGGGIRPGGSSGSVVINIANAHFTGVQDLAGLNRELGAFVQRTINRGGTTALRVALNPAR